MAGGAYLSAKNGARLFASKHFCRSDGVVMSIDGGPSSPELHTQTSNRPQLLRTSSTRLSVDCSSDDISGYEMILVFAWLLDNVDTRAEDSSAFRLQAYIAAAPWAVGQDV